MIYAHFFQCYMQFSELGNMYMNTISCIAHVLIIWEYP